MSFGGGSSGGGGGQQFNPNALLANQMASDPYASPGFDPTAYDPSSFFTNPLDVAQATMGPGDTGVGGLQPWPTDLGGTESDSTQGAPQQQGRIATQSDESAETQSILSQIAKTLNPVGSAQAKESQGSPWVTGGQPQQQYSNTGERTPAETIANRFAGKPPPLPNLPMDTGNAFWENRQASQPQDAPIQGTPVATTTTTPAEQPPAIAPLQEPPQAPGATTPRRQAAASAPAAAPPGGGPPQRPQDPITSFLGWLFPGLEQTLRGVSNQTTGYAPPERGQPLNPLQRVANAIGATGSALTGLPPSPAWERQRRLQELKRNPPSPSAAWARQRQRQELLNQQASSGFPGDASQAQNYIAQHGGYSSTGGQRTAYGATSMNPEFSNRLAAAGRAYEQETGQKPQYGEGDRDIATQERYWEASHHGRDYPVAYPGRSRHQRGEAMDIPPGPFAEWLQHNGRKYGLGFPVPHDPLHAQMGDQSGQYSIAERPPAGTRAERNNNPGNIKRGPDAAAHGATGYDAQGHAIFPDWQSGMAAQADLLRRHYAGRTIPQIAREYTATGQADWARNVMRIGGFSSNEVPNMNDPEQMSRLQNAIMRQEGFHQRQPEPAL